jgi:hypothetical protein
MKKIITILAVIGMFGFQSCTTEDPYPYVDNDTIGTVYENIAPNYYNFTQINDYSVGFDFPQRLVESDVVLVYRFDGVDNAGRPVWQALPETYYLDNGSRDFSFKFVFTDDYVNIYLDGNNRSTIPADYRLNQIFRIVVVPADFATTVNKNNFNEVMNALNLKESQVQKINF